MEAHMEDYKVLVSQLKQQDKELRLKRRWLMDLHLSERERKQMLSLKPLSDMTLPESLLREDDVQYENIKTCVAKSFGLHKDERRFSGAPASLLFDSAENLVCIYSLLDKMSNKGLCCIAETVTGGSITFEKTNWQMKRIIREFLPKILYNHDDSGQRQIKKVSQLLKDPQNFRVNNEVVCSSSESFRSAAIYVLDRLEELSVLTLSKMHRNLRDIRGDIPKLQPKKTGWGVASLVKQIRRMSFEMLSEYEEGGEPPEPLAKALSVAALMLKPDVDCRSQMVFRKLPADTEALQNEIAKAIGILGDKRKVSALELRKLPLVLDSNAKAVKESKRLRVNVRKLLTEYLLECSDLQCIPEPLLQTVAIINKTSNKETSKKAISKEEVEEEVECVLNISAQMKQIVWDLLTGSDVSEDFANAYMENIEESYDEHSSDLPQNCRSDPNVSHGQVESVGEINHSDCATPITVGLKIESVYTDEVDSVHSRRQRISATYFFPNEGPEGNGDMEQKEVARDSSVECSEVKNIPLHGQNSSRNQYLVIQEASDETSMIAYSLVGCMLNKFAQLDGLLLSEDDVFYLQGNTSGHKGFEVLKDTQISCDDTMNSIMLQVLEEIVPSFPNSGKEHLKGLLGVR